MNPCSAAIRPISFGYPLHQEVAYLGVFDLCCVGFDLCWVGFYAMLTHQMPKKLATAYSENTFLGVQFHSINI